MSWTADQLKLKCYDGSCVDIGVSWKFRTLSWSPVKLKLNKIIVGVSDAAWCETENSVESQ